MYKLYSVYNPCFLAVTDKELIKEKYDMGLFCRRNKIQLDPKTVQEIEVKAANIL